MTKTKTLPIVGEYIQDRIGHWYKVLEVQAAGWRYRVDAVYVSHNSETGETRFNSYGYRPVVMGRSEFKIDTEA